MRARCYAQHIVDPAPPPPDEPERTRLLHHEIVQIGVLILLAAGAFVLTRAVAANNADMRLRHAAEWYHRGELAIQLAQGDPERAISELLAASTNLPDDAPYHVELARLFAQAGDLPHAAGLAAVLFTVGIEQTSHRLFGLAPSSLRLFLVPPLMSLVTGVLLAKVFPDVRGSGVPQTEAAYRLAGGAIPAHVPFGKFLTGVLLSPPS